MSATTTEILNDTTSIQSRIDTVLTAEDHQLGWAADVDWMPGDPVHPREWQSHCIRPMFEELEQWAAEARCEPCQVRWRGPDPCWVCGELRPHPTMERAPRDWGTATVTVAVDIRPFVAAMQEMVRAINRLDLSGISKALDALDGYDVHHPKPLAIDGQAYRRRARSRRNR